MPIYSLDLRTISRSQNRSIVAAAAYRTGTKIEDKRNHLVFDYTRKKGVARTMLVCRDNRGNLEYPRSDFAGKLWNGAELSEKRSNSVLGRELVVALPAEFTARQCERVSQKLAEYLVTTLGVAAMLAVHDPDRKTDGRNKHLHLLFSSRRVEFDWQRGAFDFGEKTRELDDRARGAEIIKAIRVKWEQLANEELQSAGLSIDCRSLQDRGIERPARVHLGHQAAAMERKGRRTRAGDHNRAVDELEAAEIALAKATAARIAAEEAEAKARAAADQAKPIEPPRQAIKLPDPPRKAPEPPAAPISSAPTWTPYRPPEPTKQPVSPPLPAQPPDPYARGKAYRDKLLAQQAAAKAASQSQMGGDTPAPQATKPPTKPVETPVPAISGNSGPSVSLPAKDEPWPDLWPLNMTAKIAPLVQLCVYVKLNKDHLSAELKKPDSPLLRLYELCSQALNRLGLTFNAWLTSGNPEVDRVAAALRRRPPDMDRVEATLKEIQPLQPATPASVKKIGPKID